LLCLLFVFVVLCGCIRYGLKRGLIKMRAFQQLREDLRKKRRNKLWYVMPALIVLLMAAAIKVAIDEHKKMVRLEQIVGAYDSVTRQLGYSCHILSDRIVCDGAETNDQMWDGQMNINKQEHEI